jgi:hypothetical protein
MPQYRPKDSPETIYYRIFSCGQRPSSIASQCERTVQERMAHHCPYIFIDEAHHAEAPTWCAFKERFKERTVVQFTATPFREDGRPLDGDIIFKYPLKKPQQEGYFKLICFVPVVAFNRKRSDEAIARGAIEQLRADAGKGHILMARVESVGRAKEVFDLYKQYPVAISVGYNDLSWFAFRKLISLHSTLRCRPTSSGSWSCSRASS